MRVVITGGAGYVGSRVSAHLLEAGMEVVVVDKLIYGGEGVLPLLDRRDFRLIVEDIRNEEAIRTAISGADAIVHMAALVGEPACQVDPAMSQSINYEATNLLVRLASELSTERLLFLSTCSNYGVTDPNTLADEDVPLHPFSLYAKTKILAERTVLNADEHLATCVLRLGTVCGLSPRMRFDLLVNDVARRAALGRKISITTPDAWRPLLHIRDAARVIAHCLGTPSSSIKGQVFNVVGENYQKRQLGELAQKYFPHATIEVLSERPDPRSYRVAAERIFRRLGFSLANTVEEAFVQTATAVKYGVFVDPYRSIYEALPDFGQLRKIV